MPQKETLDRAAYTCMLVSYRRLPPQFQFSLSGVTLVYCISMVFRHEAGSLKMNTALEYSTRVVQEGGHRCKKSTHNDLVHLTPLRIPLMNPPTVWGGGGVMECDK